MRAEPAGPLASRPARGSPGGLAPHQAEVVEAALGGLGSGPAVTRRQVAGLRAGLVERLGALGPFEGLEVVVDGYALRRLAEGPWRPEPFSWRPRMAARSLGLRCVQEVLAGKGGGGLVGALGAAVEDAIEEDRSLGRWLAGQDCCARGATLVEAWSWASRALVAVPWRDLGRLMVFTSGLWWSAPGCPRQGRVSICGRPDASVQPVLRGRSPGRGGQVHILVKLGPAGRIGAALEALAFALVRDPAPVRVVTVAPASGEVDRYEVDRGLLEEAAAAVVAAAASLAAPGAAR